MSKQSERARVERQRRVIAATKRSQRRRRRTVVVIAVAALLAASVVVVVVVTGARPSTGTRGSVAGSSASQILPAESSGNQTVQASATSVPDTSGIPGVLAWDTTGWPGDGAEHAGALQHDHVTGPVEYSVVPPVGGPHNPVWMNAGVYTKPIPAERAVHNLEHGAVWITYRPTLSADSVAQLVAFVDKQKLIAEPASDIGISNDANRYVDLSPWETDALPSPVVISAWGHQLRVSSPSDPRLQLFVDTFRNSPRFSPEYGGGVDGIPVESGGRPARDGGTQPNPPGKTS
ncbi:MAG: DUF3105 domain-containing protein [Actinomycetota bacterium]|nr:DUF3105 domain-containing protein [Actinomycetota bacterium]